MSVKTTSVIVKRDTFCGGELLEGGKPHEVTPSQALDLIAAGKAVRKPAKESEKAVSKKSAKSETTSKKP